VAKESDRQASDPDLVPMGVLIMEVALDVLPSQTASTTPRSSAMRRGRVGAKPKGVRPLYL